MRDATHPTRLARPGQRPVLVTVVVTVALLTGCGGGSAGPKAGTVRPTTTPASSTAATGGTAAASGLSTATSVGVTAPNGYGSGPLAFSRCMRANGVPNFPDPQPGGGAVFNAAGINRGAPAVHSAMAKCQKLTEGSAGGPAPLGSTTHPSAQTLVKLLSIAECMRRHGVPEFPDPRTSVPLNPFGGGQGLITDYDGAILLFPSTLDQHTPAFIQAAAACGPLAKKLGTGPRG